MSDFDFFTVLLSFIVSLGVTSLLAAVARLLQESDRVAFSWRYLLWAAAVFNIQVTFWLKSWSYHETYVMRISTTLPPLLLAIVAYLACALASPPVPEHGRINLATFHERQGPKYALAVAAFFVVAIIQAAIMGDLLPRDGGVPLDAIVQCGFAALAVTAAFVRNRWLQIAAPIIYLVGSAQYYRQLIGW
jgi:hypothetical protein